MKVLSKDYCLIAAGILVAGAVITWIGVSRGAFDQDKFSEALYLTDKEYPVSEEFSSVVCEAMAGNIIFTRSTDAQCHVTMQNVEEDVGSVTVTEGTLYIQLQYDAKKFYRIIQLGIMENSSQITVSLPEQQYRQVQILNSMGSVTMQDVTADTIDLQTDTGDLSAKELTCKTLSAKADTGDIAISGLRATKEAEISIETGMLKMERCEVAGKTSCSSDVGDCQFTGCTFGESTMQNDCGKVAFLDCTALGDWEITTDTGSIECNLTEAVNVIAESDIGEVTIDGERTTEKMVPDAKSVVKLSSDVGSINVNT